MIQHYANIQKTPKGFPSKTRPKVVAVFLKNGHSYKRDYQLKYHSFGSEVSGWWKEISNLACVGYGGPTGIYTLVVLMAWWSTFLRDHPDSEHANYLAIVGELDHAILAVIAENSPIAHSSTGHQVPAASSPSPQPNNDNRAKRAHHERSSSRKRQRV